MYAVHARDHVRVGTCGFPETQGRVLRDFDMAEVQQTFDQPPRVATAERWRASAPPGFTFTLKAWQLITHEAGSPTHRRLREELSDKERAHCGALRWNPTTRMAWARTEAVAEALDAEAIVFQTPPSFTPTTANLRNLHRFFEAIDRRGRRMVFEPRGGAWTEQVLRPLLADLDLVHGVDPFVSRPVGRGLRYFRLPGHTARRDNHRYTDADLAALAAMLNGAWPNRVLFNNDAMAHDARRFLALLHAEQRLRA